MFSFSVSYEYRNFPENPCTDTCSFHIMISIYSKCHKADFCCEIESFQAIDIRVPFCSARSPLLRRKFSRSFFLKLYFIFTSKHITTISLVLILLCLFMFSSHPIFHQKTLVIPVFGLFLKLGEGVFYQIPLHFYLPIICFSPLTCSWQGGWNQMIFKVPSNPYHSMTL